MNTRTLSALAALAALAFATALPAAAQTVLDRAVISTGGGTSTSATSRLDYTIAEPVTGVATNGRTVGQFGFWTAGGSVILSVDENRAGSITAMRLAPNPVSDATRLSLALGAASDVSLSLHDASGRSVATRELGRLEAGEHAIPIDLAGLASGSYSLVASVDGAMMRIAVTVVR